MKSTVIKRSVVIDGYKTSISIEDAFWRSLKEIADEKAMTLSRLVSTIKSDRTQNSNLSSAIRVYILSEIRSRLSMLQGADGGQDSAVSKASAIERPPAGVR
jgi:predicted DNA-binding ribbon-helix-helix protein